MLEVNNFNAIRISLASPEKPDEKDYFYQAHKQTGEVFPQAVDAMTAQGVPAESARTMLSQLVEGQSVMLATLNMFGVIAVCLGVAATIIWLHAFATWPAPLGPMCAIVFP